MSVFYVIVSIFIFGLLIAVHEGGHFAAAKLCGVKVEEFSIGMGPAVWKRQRGETLYALRCIPLGGYCAMSGEDGESDDPRAFTNQKPWKRLIILAAGSFMNFLLGLVILGVLYSSAAAFVSPTVAEFRDGCPYEGEDGLQLGDRFLSVDGHRIFEYYDVSDYLDNGAETHDIVVRRDGRRVKLEDFPMVRIEYPDMEGKYYGFSFGYEEMSLGTWASNVWSTAMEFGRWVWTGLEQLLTGGAKVQDMSGAVGIVDLMTETGEQAETTADGLYNVFYIGAFIAVNLAMMNLLPIPALDGGRVFLLLVTWLIESITHKKLDPKYEAWIHAVGMILLLGLMGVILFNDVVKLFGR